MYVRKEYVHIQKKWRAKEEERQKGLQPAPPPKKKKQL
jgi:hypothetical protein